MTVLARTVLFVSSYAPLLVLFAMLESFGAGYPSYVCIGAAAVSVVLLVVVWLTVKAKFGSDFETFEGARSRDADVMAYVVTYVVPFAAATDNSGATRAALGVFAALIAVLYIRSSVFYVHPLLLLVGIHVYEATNGGTPVIVLTRRRHLRQTARLRAAQIGATMVYVEVKQ